MRGHAAPEGADESGEVVTRDARRVRKLRGWPNEPRASVRVSNDAPHTSVVPFVPGASLLGQRGGAAATAASFEWAKHPGGCRRVGEPRRTPCARQTGLQGLWDVLLAGTHRASGSSGGVGRRREVALPFSRSLAGLGVPPTLHSPGYTYSASSRPRCYPAYRLLGPLYLRGSATRVVPNSRQLRRSASLNTITLAMLPPALGAPCCCTRLELPSTLLAFHCCLRALQRVRQGARHLAPYPPRLQASHNSHQSQTVGTPRLNASGIPRTAVLPRTGQSGQPCRLRPDVDSY